MASLLVVGPLLKETHVRLAVAANFRNPPFVTDAAPFINEKNGLKAVGYSCLFNLLAAKVDTLNKIAAVKRHKVRPPT